MATAPQERQFLMPTKLKQEQTWPRLPESLPSSAHLAANYSVFVRCIRSGVHRFTFTPQNRFSNASAVAQAVTCLRSLCGPQAATFAVLWRSLQSFLSG